jgi:ADP-ribose pyrophosphatase YjhB (NUDIX family)
MSMSRTLSFPRPLTTVDVVIFSASTNALEVLLVRRPAAADEPFPGMWALPGGFIDTAKDADLEA